MCLIYNGLLEEPMHLCYVVAPSNLTMCWSFHKCSATTDTSSVPLQQASRCSLNLVSSLLVPPMQQKVIQYTTSDYFYIGRRSFTLVYQYNASDCQIIYLRNVPSRTEYCIPQLSPYQNTCMVSDCSIHFSVTSCNPSQSVICTIPVASKPSFLLHVSTIRPM